MGLDRTAAAMMVAASDDRGPSAPRTWSSWPGVRRNAVTEVFDVRPGTRARHSWSPAGFAIPAVEAKGSLLLEDVGVPSRAGRIWSAASPGWRPTGLMISVIAHAGDGNTHPLIVDPK